MYVTAVDRAGNESKPSNIVQVTDTGDNESAYAAEENGHAGSYLIRLNPLQGNWAGEGADGKPATLSILRHQFRLTCGDDTIDGFVQVWNDEKKVPQMSVDTGMGDELTGPYELEGNKLKLRLQRPGATRYYDLRMNR